MKPSTKAKLIPVLETIGHLLTKCGGPGGTPGPCPIGGHGGGKGKTHNVQLPKNPKKLTIQQAHEAMSQMGHKMTLGSYDLKKKTATYHVEFADGTKKTVTSDEMKKIVYDGHSSKH